MSTAFGPTQRQVHVLIGCSDARDIGGIFAESVAAVRSAYRARGVAVEFHAIRTPGSFVTADVLDDLHRIVENSEREADASERVRYFVHIQTHGEVQPERADGSHAPPTGLTIVAGSPFNCGMLGAARVSVELEDMILRTKPRVISRCGMRTLGDDDAIRELLFETYAHRGALAGDWIRSIDDLRTHPRLQESVLRRAIESSRMLRSVGIEITAGIQDYGRNVYVRLDGHPDRQTFWDDVYVELRERYATLPPDHPEIAQRTSTQAPAVGLFATCDVPDARSHAAAAYERIRGMALGEFGPNQVFAFASGSFDLPRSPFGPYTVAGFFYAVYHLKLRDFVVMGRDGAQVLRMISRLHNDPLIELITTSQGVTFHPIEVGALTCCR